MSFKLGVKGLQEVLVLALMLVFVVAFFYTNMEFSYKLGIGVLVFTIIFLTTLASQVLKQQEEESKRLRA
jgi:uncharacterized protein (DUF486 family)